MKDYRPLFQSVYKSSIKILKEIEVLRDNLTNSNYTNRFKPISGWIQTYLAPLSNEFDFPKPIQSEGIRKIFSEKLESNFRNLFLEYAEKNPNAYIKNKHLSFQIKEIEKAKVGGALVLILKKVSKSVNQIEGQIFIRFPKELFELFMNKKISVKSFAHDLSRMITHELAHWDQYAARSIKCKAKNFKKYQYYMMSVSLDETGHVKKTKISHTEYVSNHHEINSYALNVAQHLLFRLYGQFKTPILGAKRILSKSKALEDISPLISGLAHYCSAEHSNEIDLEVRKKFLKKVYQNLDIFGEDYGKNPYCKLKSVQRNNKISNRKLLTTH